MNGHDDFTLGWDRQYVTREEYLDIMSKREKLSLEENRKVGVPYYKKLLGIFWLSLTD